MLLFKGFELMGSVSNSFSNFENKSQVTEWRNLVYLIAKRYICEYETEVVMFYMGIDHKWTLVGFKCFVYLARSLPLSSDCVCSCCFICVQGNTDLALSLSGTLRHGMSPTTMILTTSLCQSKVQSCVVIWAKILSIFQLECILLVYQT